MPRGDRAAPEWPARQNGRDVKCIRTYWIARCVFAPDQTWVTSKDPKDMGVVVAIVQIE